MSVIATAVFAILSIASIVLGFIFAGDSPREHAKAGLCVAIAVAFFAAAMVCAKLSE